MPLLSVIIPAYNAAKTVEKTVRSVMASTIPLDVYVVDDGSTDETASVVERLNSQPSTPNSQPSTLNPQLSTPNSQPSTLNSQPSTLHLLRQANQGAYMARLNALKQIATPYFGFVDADDTVEPDMFEKMLAVAEREKCDVVQCGVEGLAESALGQWYVGLRENFLPDRRAVEDGFIRPNLVRGEGSSFIWNKLYRNQYDFATFATFDRLTNYDDLIFNMQFFEKVARMAFLTDRLYHYATTSGSAAHSFGARQFADFWSCVKFRRARGMLGARWLAVNLKNVIVSAMRAGIGR